jgi:hypothetical protein
VDTPRSPPNDINTNPASGMTAKDYAAMYRHVILRLRADGVGNAISVLAYMGNEKWMAQSLRKDPVPGRRRRRLDRPRLARQCRKGLYHYGD